MQINSSSSTTILDQSNIGLAPNIIIPTAVKDKEKSLVWEMNQYTNDKSNKNNISGTAATLPSLFEKNTKLKNVRRLRNRS